MRHLERHGVAISTAYITFHDVHYWITFIDTFDK